MFSSQEVWLHSTSGKSSSGNRENIRGISHQQRLTIQRKEIRFPQKYTAEQNKKENQYKIEQSSTVSLIFFKYPLGIWFCFIDSGSIIVTKNHVIMLRYNLIAVLLVIIIIPFNDATETTMRMIMAVMRLFPLISAFPPSRKSVCVCSMKAVKIVIIWKNIMKVPWMEQERNS